MSETIPENVVRNIIADILFSRSNDIDLNANELIEEDKNKIKLIENNKKIKWKGEKNQCLIFNLIEEYFI